MRKMSESSDLNKKSRFNSLTEKLVSLDWDMSIDHLNEAFITAFENDNEKWELEVQFDSEDDYLVSSRSRWNIEKEQIDVMSRVIDRMNADYLVDTFGSEICVNKKLFCFEVKTRGELPMTQPIDSLFDAIEQNTSLYGRWSDTVRKAVTPPLQYSENSELLI